MLKILLLVLCLSPSLSLSISLYPFCILVSVCLSVSVESVVCCLFGRITAWKNTFSHQPKGKTRQSDMYHRYNLVTCGKKKETAVNLLDGFCKSLYKIGFICLKMSRCDWWDQCALMAHLCMLAGQLSQDGSSSWSLPTLLLSFSVSVPPFPSFSCTTQPPTPPPFPCLLFFSSGGERANKQTNKWHFYCADVWISFPDSQTFTFFYLKTLNTCDLSVFKLCLVVVAISGQLIGACQTNTAITKELAAV